MRYRIFTVMLFLLSFIASISFASNAEELAKATQNPVSDLISVPFQNNIEFRVGPYKKTQNILNIQPVWPFRLNNRWNIITRTIFPLISRPAFYSTENRTFGLGDTLFTAFLSPKKPGAFIWGLGPAILIPTATDKTLGSEKWGLGPSAVVLSMQGSWVYGALINNLWSFAGNYSKDPINLFTLQPFINYNFNSGLYLTSSPIITANWKADPSSNRWVVPIGGGIGKIFKLGNLPINAQIQGFYHIIRSELGAHWSLRLQLQLLFPKT